MNPDHKIGAVYEVDGNKYRLVKARAMTMLERMEQLQRQALCDHKGPVLLTNPPMCGKCHKELK